MAEYNWGILALLSYNLLTAAKGVFLGAFLQKIPPFLVLGVCFGLVTIFFTVFNRIKNKSSNTTFVLPILKKNWRVVIGLNVSAVLGWGSYFFALKLIEPAIVVSFTQGAGPVITALYYLFWCKDHRTTKIEWYTHAATTVILGFLVLISYLGLSAVGSISARTVLIGTLAAITCGITNVMNTVLTKTLSDEGLKPRQIIPARFYLLIITGAFFTSGSMWHSLVQIEVISSIAMIAMFGVALPVLLVQVGIQKTNPVSTALTMAALPIFMLACQFFDNRLTASIYSVMGAFMVAVIYMISLVLKSPSQIIIKKSTYTEAL